MKPILKLTDVNKSFGGVVVAQNVCVELQEGTIHGLIGPNGAGKTTLLNLISGIYDVDSGTIEFDGKVITKMPAHQRARLGIGRTFQMPRFLDRSDIEDNLLLARDLGVKCSFISSFFGKKDKTYIKELEMLTNMADFSYYLEDDVTSLTFGQRKLLEIIRAILTNPKVILVDEPAAGLNGAEIEHAVGLLEWAAKEKNIGIILIEHSMDMIMSVCSSITVLNFGSVIACGTPDEIACNEDVITAYLGRENDA
ncbi:MAG: ABC transporter ATP-binding protein [Oscillospiraceae bacterium]